MAFAGYASPHSKKYIKSFLLENFKNLFLHLCADFAPELLHLFFVACPCGAHRYSPLRLLQVQRSDFSLAKIQAIVQGASGWALVPFMLFSAVALRTGCLVSVLAAIWRVRLVLWLWLLFSGAGVSI